MMRGLLGAAAFLWLTLPALAQAPSVCPDNFDAFADTAEPLTCTCDGAAAGRGSVWGMDVYTADSSICRAALHAGLVGRGGGAVTVLPEAGRNAYPGVTRNGVSSSNFGRYKASFRFAQGAAPPTAGAPPAPAAPAPAATASVCPDNLDAYAGTSEPVACTCTAEAAGRGSVWGMDIYTSDSSVCRAALHAGAVGRAGGPVTVLPEPGRAFYPGVTRNGVASANFRAYKASFSFAKAGAPAAGGTASAIAPGSVCPDNLDAYADTAEPVACTCGAEAATRGSVWGMDVYTADSSVCRAALHAGLIGRTGGPVTVLPEAGRNAYPGVTRNGVSSSNFGAYKASFRFQGAAPAVAAPPPPPAPPPAQVAAAPVQQPIAETIRQRGEVALYIRFKFNAADLDMGSAETLLELRNVLRADPGLRLFLVGHTDAVGGADYNRRLSQRRADATKAWLVAQGIPAARLTTGGQGAEQPLADNATEAGRAANRRVQAIRMP
jgi:outer membrane protein OmpA-like peptidoglycan-associated protein